MGSSQGFLLMQSQGVFSLPLSPPACSLGIQIQIHIQISGPKTRFLKEVVDLDGSWKPLWMGITTYRVSQKIGIPRHFSLNEIEYFSFYFGSKQN